MASNSRKPNREKPRVSSDIASLLRQLRGTAGIGIKTLAPKLNVDYTYLSKLENGVAHPSQGFLARVAQYYGVNVDQLYLAAGHLPPDVENIIEHHPDEVISLIRERFGHGDSE